MNIDIIEKKQKIFCMFSMLQLRRASFLQLFQKFVLSPQAPTFIQKFINKFFYSIVFKKRTNFPLKFDLPLTPKSRLLSSNVRSVSE